MKTLLKLGLTGLCGIAAALPLAADDLRGSDDYLCAGTTALGDEACFEVKLRDLNVPRFIEIDLDQKKMRSTKASGLNRETDIKNLERQNGLVILQGVQDERAFRPVARSA